MFILSGAEDLVPVLVENIDGEWVQGEPETRTVDNTNYSVRRYRPRIEGLFARIERWTNENDSSDGFWRSISRDNVTTWYGRSSNSRIADPANPEHIFSWLICESHDDKGNVSVYRYREEDSTGVKQFQAHERNRTETNAFGQPLRQKHSIRQPQASFARAQGRRTLAGATGKH